jgi:hypothetical protein
MQYQTVKALNYLDRNNKGASFFGLFEANNEKIYQVKFDQPFLKSNTKEFIANFIAGIVDVPTPSAVMIYIPQTIIQELNKVYGLNLQASQTNYYFGLEWEEHVNDSWTCFNEFKEELQKINNYKDFLSIYPFDQFFRNYDRHLGNHLISVKNNHFYFYLAIDADRIFAGAWLENARSQLRNFSCFPEQFHNELYSLITDAEYKTLLIHAAKYKTIRKEDLKKLNQQLCNTFAINEKNIATIIIFLLYRKTKLLDKCLDNISCFPNIKYPSLNGGK